MWEHMTYSNMYSFTKWWLHLINDMLVEEVFGFKTLFRYPERVHPIKQYGRYGFLYLYLFVSTFGKQNCIYEFITLHYT